MNDNNFEGFLNRRIKLLSPRNFFNQLLNDYTVLTVCITRSDLNMKIAAEYNALYDGTGC
jgi:hypothetical protein